MLHPIEAHLLVIEENVDVARGIDRAFVEAGCSVHRVPTGDEGLAYLADHEVSGVVLEHRLPCTDGLELLRRIRERHRGMPIVVIAGAGSVDGAMRAAAPDVVEARNGYLAELVETMRAALARANARALRSVPRPVCVGRHAERRVLADALARARAREGRVVLVTGDEGMGKTSIAGDAETLATAAGALVLWGRCVETGDAPAYWPWIRVLRGLEKHVGAERLRRELGAAGRLVGPPVAGVAPADGAPLGSFPVLDGVTQCLRRAAQERPLAIVLDDVHHADGSSLELLRFVAAEIRDAAIVLIATARDAGTSPAAVEIARLADGPFTTVLRLAPLGEEDVGEYVAVATGVRPTEALVRAIHAKTEGHPLFVSEVVRLLAADGRLGEDPEGGRLRRAIPETRRHAVVARLGRVSAACRRMLEVAAVIGRDFDLELVARVLDAPSVTAAIEEAAEAGVVVAGADDLASCRFSHMLVRDVVYDDVPIASRTALHVRVARALEEGPAAEVSLAAIAHHYFEAAAGTDDVETAVGYAIAAGDRATRLRAYEEAARHYAHALRAAERAGGPVAGVLVKLAEARWCTGEVAEARAVARRLVRLAHDAGDPVRVATAALVFAGRLPGLGAIECDDEVVAVLEHALVGLPPTASALRAMVMARLAEELTYSPRRGTDRTLASQAVALARSLDDPAVLASVLRTTQWSLWTPDDVERRRQLAEEIVGLAARTGDRVLALDGELLRYWSALEHGEMDLAHRQLALVTRLASELRLPYYAWITTAARACMDIASGRLDQAERVADESQRAGDPRNATVRLFAGAQRGHVMWHRGRFDELARWLESVVGEFPMLASAVQCSLVLTYVSQGQRELAQAELARFAADDFAAVPRNAMWLMNMTNLADGCVALGDVAAARRLYPLLAPFARYNVLLVPAEVGSPVARYMAGLAELLGDVPAARRHYEDALVLGARTGTLQYVAHTQLGYARLLRASDRSDDHERAAKLVAGARAIANELGLAPVLDALAAEPPPASRTARDVFRRRGEVWDVAFGGHAAIVPHRVGMEYIHRLLERPGDPVAAVELASAGGEGVLLESDGDPIHDRRALDALRARMAELADRIEARVRGDEPGDPDPLRAEVEQLEAEFRRRGRTYLGAAERARTAVTKAIDRAIDEIAEVHEALGRHLELHVRTGRHCVYIPDAVAPVRFDL
jgi:CheY-like chemotaxis protein/tetratricopeptide (TPR) repeat protein